MVLVAGIDSSTQSCKVVVCDAEDGMIVRSGVRPHPGGTEVDPGAWVAAMAGAVAEAGGLDDVAAVSVAAQQHGLICLDENGDVVRNALLWNDTRSAGSAEELIEEFGGRQRWVDEVGVVPVAAITAAKLRWLADREPANADRTAAVCLPHDWLTWRLAGAPGLDALTTDRSDASGTGYFSAATDTYRPEILDLALRGRTPLLPRVIGPFETAGTTERGQTLGPGAGDNAAAALGLAAAPGDCVVSLGTSGVVSAITDTPPRDAEGLVAGFADATGRQLPLICTLNGAPVLASTARLLGVGLDEFSRLALSAPPGAEGLTLVPYLAGERSPNLPGAAGALHGITLTNLTPANIARAAVEGLLCSLVFCLDRLAAQGVAIDRILLVGGGTKSPAVRALAPALFARDVLIPAPAEYVALGAARQAAWTRTKAEPTWTATGTPEISTALPTPDVVARYNDLRTRTSGQ